MFPSFTCPIFIIGNETLVKTFTTSHLGHGERCKHLPEATLLLACLGATQVFSPRRSLPLLTAGLDEEKEPETKVHLLHLENLNDLSKGLDWKQMHASQTSDWSHMTKHPHKNTFKVSQLWIIHYTRKRPFMPSINKMTQILSVNFKTSSKQTYLPRALICPSGLEDRDTFKSETDRREEKRHRAFKKGSLWNWSLWPVCSVP